MCETVSVAGSGLSISLVSQITGCAVRQQVHLWSVSAAQMYFIFCLLLFLCSFTGHRVEE